MSGKIIVKYKIFSSSEEFEAWQAETDIQLHLICPVSERGSFANTFSQGREYPQWTDSISNISVFVTYSEINPKGVTL
jgi:hypothetical protein